MRHQKTATYQPKDALNLFYLFAASAAVLLIGFGLLLLTHVIDGHQRAGVLLVLLGILQGYGVRKHRRVTSKASVHRGPSRLSSRPSKRRIMLIASVMGGIGFIVGLLLEGVGVGLILGIVLLFVGFLAAVPVTHRRN